jgi:hypothetical protein
MKKKLFALSGVFMIVLVIAGLWGTRATNLNSVKQTIDSSSSTSLATAMSVEAMTKGASAIITGKVLETKSQWIGRRLVTIANIAVTEQLKGNEASTLRVVLPGGVDSKRKFPVSMMYAGAPQMYATQDVFVFLDDAKEESVPNSYSVMGFSQGLFSIGADAGGEQVVTRNLTHVRMQKGIGVTRGNHQAVRLSELKARVKEYLK